MNKMTMIGNLTRDPELRATKDGTPVCDFTLAVNGRKAGQEAAQYFRVTVWRKLGETCAQYLSKGRKVYVEGPLTARTYQANDGSTRVSLEVTAEDVEFLSARSEGEKTQAAPAATRQAPPRVDEQTGFQVMETEELPF